MRDIGEILEQAREVYGKKNQILVAIEELNELACVLAKYPRYENSDKATKDLHNKVIDEFADVLIVLDHVHSIFEITDEELVDRIEKKTARLERWLSHSNSMEETTRDRVVDKPADNTSGCKPCKRAKTERSYNEYCVHCLKARSTDGEYPFFEK